VSAADSGKVRVCPKVLALLEVTSYHVTRCQGAALWALVVFLPATTVREIAPRSRSEPSPPLRVSETGEPNKAIAKYPNHVWSVVRLRRDRDTCEATRAGCIAGVSPLLREKLSPAKGAAYLCPGRPPGALSETEEGVREHRYRDAGGVSYFRLPVAPLPLKLYTERSREGPVVPDGSLSGSPELCPHGPQLVTVA